MATAVCDLGLLSKNHQSSKPISPNPPRVMANFFPNGWLMGGNGLVWAECGLCDVCNAA
ncbi:MULTISPECIES: hypothetical protein [Nostocaceae]|uniref:hypothetical protein n=1 Tax=Nostocaceae TaxID=1162 RepID=UPI0012938E92|nr:MULTISPECIES: hypothetical protein [Nostocaceae]MBD2381809.1 hypothetical protein [Trichormus variabilis FACHB-319]